MSQVQQPASLGTGLWHTVRRPRVVLALLGCWAIVSVATEFFTSSGLFMDLHGVEIDGALAGRALSWQGIALAALYFDSMRDPSHHRRAFSGSV